MVVHAYYPSRETRVQREASVLVDRGYEVDVLCLRGAAEPIRSTEEGVTVYRLPVGRNLRRGFLFQLVEYVVFFVLAGAALTALHLRRRYHVVQVHNLPDFLVFTALVPKLTGSRVLLDLHDLMPEFFSSRAGVGMNSPFVRLLQVQEQFACRFADQVITVTDGWRETLIGRGVPPPKVSVVMNVADARIFSRSDVASDAGPPQPEFRILYHGTFTHRYGVDLILEAVAQVREEIPGLSVRLQGGGDFTEHLLTRRADLGLEDCTEITETVIETSDLAALIRTADVGIVPNRRDVFTDGILPTKLLEYVACGTAVIAARTPAIESYFDDGMVMFFEPGDPGDLAGAIRVLAEDRRRLRTLAENADAFNRTYGWEAVADTYAGLVDAAAGNHGRHAEVPSRGWGDHASRNS